MTTEEIVAAQERRWLTDLEGAKKGNPFATLCLKCYGRHAPPRHEMCPAAAPQGRQEPQA